MLGRYPHMVSKRFRTVGGDKSRADSAACVSCHGDCEVARGETAYKDEDERFVRKEYFLSDVFHNL